MRLLTVVAMLLALSFAGPAHAASRKARSPGTSRKAAKVPAPAPVVPAPATAPVAPAPEPERVAAPEQPSPPPAPSPTAPRRVAVLDPKKTGEIPERAYAAFTQSLVSELRKLQGVSAIGMSEIRDMLAFERQRQLLGCGDEGCLAEIGGALGVDELVTTQLSLTGSKYTLSMKRVNLRRAKVMQAETRQFEQRDGEELLAIVGPMIEAIFPERPLKEGRIRGVEAAVIQRLNPPPLPRWVFVTTGVAAVAAAGAAGVFALQSRSAERTWKDMVDGSVNGDPVSGRQLAEYQRSAQDNARLANILFGVAGGLAVAAAVEAIFTDWHNDRLAVAVGPAGVGVAGTF